MSMSKPLKRCQMTSGGKPFLNKVLSMFLRCQTEEVPQIWSIFLSCVPQLKSNSSNFLRIKPVPLAFCLSFFSVLQIEQKLFNFWQFAWMNQLAFVNDVFGQRGHISVCIEALHPNSETQQHCFSRRSDQHGPCETRDSQKIDSRPENVTSHQWSCLLKGPRNCQPPRTHTNEFYKGKKEEPKHQRNPTTFERTRIRNLWKQRWTHRLDFLFPMLYLNLLKKIGYSSRTRSMFPRTFGVFA